MWLMHSFLIYHREKACRDVYWVCLLAGGHRASLSHTMSLLFLTSFLFMCVHAYECAGADARVHTCVGQRRILGRKDLTVQEASPFWPGRLVRLLGSGYLTVLKLQAHEAAPSFFVFCFFLFIDPSVFFIFSFYWKYILFSYNMSV